MYVGLLNPKIASVIIVLQKFDRKLQITQNLRKYLQKNNQ